MANCGIISGKEGRDEHAIREYIRNQGPHSSDAAHSPLGAQKKIGAASATPQP